MCVTLDTQPTWAGAMNNRFVLLAIETVTVAFYAAVVVGFLWAGWRVLRDLSPSSQERAANAVCSWMEDRGQRVHGWVFVPAGHTAGPNPLCGRRRGRQSG